MKEKVQQDGYGNPIGSPWTIEREEERKKVKQAKRLDEFMELITKHINPVRVKAGVSEINEDDARSSFLIIEMMNK